MTPRRLLPLAPIFLVALLSACSDTKVPVGSPHPLGKEWFVGAGAHGTSTLECSECHDVGSFCFQCHFGPTGARVPPGEDWLHGTFPHDRNALKDVGDVCDRCHTLTMRYADEPPACHRCHEAPPLPHPMGEKWLSSRSSGFHGRNDVLNLLRCSSCHDLDVFCTQCHFGPTGSRVPDGVTWTHGWGSHTQAVLIDARAACVRCHELTQSFGYGPPNATCFGCHDGAFPMHALPYADAHKADAKENLRACQQCHGTPGTSFESGVSQVACATCHTAAKAHPTDWQGSGTASHRTAGNIETACVLCHDVFAGRTAPLQGAPSCFSATFTNADGQTRACHVGGWAAHSLPFADPALHGAPAKADLAFCQNCHGAPGTILFTGGSAGVACADCHTAAKAHPTDWQGSGTYSHRTAGNTGTACALCHDVTQGRTAPNPAAPSCFSASFTNANGQTRECHPGGPGVPHAPAAQFRVPSAHGPEAKKDFRFCQTCHGVPGTPRFDGGSAKACADCHTAARAHPTDWQGAGTYSHRTAGSIPAACALCHKTDGTGAGPLSGAPSCFSASFTNPAGQNRACHPGGPGVPHAPAAQFVAPTAHGPEAKKDFLYCQTCHGRPGTVFFDGGTAPACATCHTAAKAHPTDWQGSGTYSHRNAGNTATACSICHDYTQGRTAPVAAAPSCYSATFTNGNAQNRACHPGGPLTHPLGQPWLDKKSAQFHGDSSLTCSNCHTVASFCSQCHFGPTGSRVPPGTGWTHGFNRHPNYETYQTVCNACHNVNRRYGNAPRSCHDCHGDGD